MIVLNMGFMRFSNLCLGMRVLLALLLVIPFVSSCSPADVPDARFLDVPDPERPDKKRKAVNDGETSVVRIPLGDGVFVPSARGIDRLPSDEVGPYELRSEPLATALKLILADYDIPLAFETEDAFTQTVTVTGLKGRVDRVISRICGFVDLFCAYEDGMLVVKESQTFAVTLPPIGNEEGLTQFQSGLASILGGDGDVVLDQSSRSLIYSATHRTQDNVEAYFRHLRNNTAMIVFELYIWEVQLENNNSAGINWSGFFDLGRYGVDYQIAGGAPSLESNVSPIVIGPVATSNANVESNEIFEFISEYGAVKVVSQPQLTMLSGSEATLDVSETRNYINEITISESADGTSDNFSTTTDELVTGLTITITGQWDNKTIFGNLSIEVDEFIEFQEFPTGTDGTLNLPRTTTRSLQTQIRIRPGDTMLVAGLVSERDNYVSSGPGSSAPVLPTARTTELQNSELVFLLRPRVVIFEDMDDDYADEVEKAVSAVKNNKEEKGSDTDPSVIDGVQENASDIFAPVSGLEKTLGPTSDSGLRRATSEQLLGMMSYDDLFGQDKNSRRIDSGSAFNARPLPPVRSEQVSATVPEAFSEGRRSVDDAGLNKNSASTVSILDYKGQDHKEQGASGVSGSDVEGRNQVVGESLEVNENYTSEGYNQNISHPVEN